jgi:hypothetical protein
VSLQFASKNANDIRKCFVITDVAKLSVVTFNTNAVNAFGLYYFHNWVQNFKIFKGSPKNIHLIHKI